MPPFVHEDKNPGDLIRSKDWNLLGNEVLRLGADKISRVGEESLDGPLTVRGALAVGAGSAGGGLTVKGELSVGTTGAGAAVRVLRRQEDGKDTTHGALVLGTDSAASAALRLGYYSTYSWLQGQGQQNIAINPFGGNVGIGTAAAPAARLHVEGDLRVTGNVSWGNNALLRPDQGGSLELGGNNETAGTGSPYIDFHFKDKKEDYNVRLINDADKRLSLLGGDLRLETGREVFFADNGQIRSLDNNHRILFRRSENKLELREWGAIVFSPGAKDGTETAKATLTADGQLGIGTTAPKRLLHVEGSEIHSGGAGAGFSFSNRESAWGSGAGERWVWYSTAKSARLWTETNGDQLQVHADGVVSAGSFAFGNDSRLVGDQGGSIELGGSNTVAGTGTPYIDFHYKGKKQDYNARIINDADAQLTVAGTGVVKLECWDLMMGHSGRRGSPGRALVDGSDGSAKVLILNYDSDWGGGVRHYGAMKQVSTRTIKEDIEPLEAPEAAALLAGLEPVRYRMIGDETREEHLGFIAEEVPDVISGPEHTAIANNHIVAVLTRVVKEQQRRLDELAHRLEQGLSA
jgi:hypothetical protein